MTTILHPSLGTVTIESTRFGTFAVSPGDVIEVRGPIPGFNSFDSLVVIPVDEHHIFVWVQAAKVADLAFLAVNPFVFYPDYDVEISPEEEELLGVEPGDDLIIYTLVSIRGEEATTNLAAPLVVNATRRSATQPILSTPWPLKAPLRTSAESRGQSGGGSE